MEKKAIDNTIKSTDENILDLRSQLDKLIEENRKLRKDKKKLGKAFTNKGGISIFSLWQAII